MEKKQIEFNEKDLEQAVGGRHNIREPLKSTFAGVVRLDTDEAVLSGFQPTVPAGFTSAGVCRFNPCQGSDCPSYDFCNDSKKQ